MIPPLLNASSVHPLLVHFPIALFTTAFLCDLLLVARSTWAWLDKTAVLLYGLSSFGAMLAAISGKLAASEVEPILPSQTWQLVQAHGDWAFGAAVAMFVATIARLEALHRDSGSGQPTLHRFRMASLALALAAGTVLWLTAARGGELVYRHGVGVEGAADPTR